MILAVLALALFIAGVTHCRAVEAAEQVFEPDRWHLISIPSDGESSAAVSLLRGLGEAPGAQLFSYTAGRYLDATGDTDGRAVADGLGLWYRHTGPPVRVNVPAPARPTNLDCTTDSGCAIRDLGPAGWAMLGSPYARPVGVAGRVEVYTATPGTACNPVACSFAEAAAAGLVHFELFALDADGARYVDRSALTLEPWGAVWILAKVDDLRVVIYSPWCAPK